MKNNQIKLSRTLSCALSRFGLESLFIYIYIYVDKENILKALAKWRNKLHTEYTN